MDISLLLGIIALIFSFLNLIALLWSISSIRIAQENSERAILSLDTRLRNLEEQAPPTFTLEDFRK